MERWTNLGRPRIPTLVNGTEAFSDAMNATFHNQTVNISSFLFHELQRGSLPIIKMQGIVLLAVPNMEDNSNKRCYEVSLTVRVEINSDKRMALRYVPGLLIRNDPMNPKRYSAYRLSLLFRRHQKMLIVFSIKPHKWRSLQHCIYI